MQAPAPAETARHGNFSFWFYDHPLVSPAFARTEGETFKLPGEAGAAMHPQYIGEWPQAIQKLTVSLAADEPPDAALVKRDWLARLVGSGRIRDLEGILPRDFIEDLRPEIREACTFHGHLVALPADGFCSVLLSNRGLVGEHPPDTWAGLRAMAEGLASRAKRDAAFYPIGAMPFLEALWSAGGTVIADSHNGLTTPQARKALDFISGLRADGLAAPLEEGDFQGGLEMLMRQRVAMTVVFSDALPGAAKATFPVAAGPIPGETGGVSRLSNNMVVFFAGGGPLRADVIVALARYLTGPDVQGRGALAKGSVPVRRSVLKSLSPQPGLRAASRAVRGTPLAAPWSEIEFELDCGLDSGYRWIARQESSKPDGE